MRILVTGRQGQVALALAERGPVHGVQVSLIGRPTLDLEEPATIARALGSEPADIIVNAAAYTAVDKAESDAERAFRVNAEGAGAVAQTAAEAGVPLIHLSTDYVFDGSLDRPYREDDPTNPLGVYGRSKLAGEARVLAAHPRALVLRTAWVYSPFGSNFVKTMLRLGETRDSVRVVGDQCGRPTSALDIADALIAVAIAFRDGRGVPGVFHLSGEGEASWAHFAGFIFQAAARIGRPPVTVERITTADYPTPAARPRNSRLDTGKLEQTYGIALPRWRESTEACVARLLLGGKT